MTSLVVEEFHSEEGAEATADSGERQENALGNAPKVALSLPLVDAVDEEGDGIEDEEYGGDSQEEFLGPRFSIWRG